MSTLSPPQPTIQERPQPMAPRERRERRVSAVPRALFWLAAAFLILAPVIATLIVDTSGSGHHLALGHFFLAIPSSIFAISAIVLGLIARPGRVVSRTLRIWLDISLGTLLAGVAGTALAPFLAPSPGSVSILGGIAVVVAFLGLAGYIIAFVVTLIVRRWSRG